MKEQYIKIVATELSVNSKQVKAVLELLNDGATVPFIARYRKELTNNLDETQIIAIRDRLEEIETLEKRRASIINSLEKRELLNPSLEQKLKQADTLTVLEDIYLPYRPKRKTRAMAARERGLEELSKTIMSFTCNDIYAEAEKYLNKEQDVLTVEDALTGASDIIAEGISENAEIRGGLREVFEKKAFLSSAVVKKKIEEAEKYKDYFQYSEKLSNVPSHRFLAVMRGAAEGFLKWHILPKKEDALLFLEKNLFNANSQGKKCPKQSRDFIKTAINDAWDRLLSPSLETEFKNATKKEADMTAIEIFAGNVRNLLLEPPLGRKSIIAVDPGLRTGCKLVVLSPEGKLLSDAVIYPLVPHKKEAEATQILTTLAKKYSIEAVAVGNGTGGREAESFLRSIFTSIPVVSVNESGASIYSASEIARREFPDKDVTVRGAVSIGRRLMDPLAELVKIEPKSIGVGQYQHDVDQKLLKKSLDDVVISCVNLVGVELNTASRELLSYVSGLNEKIADKLVSARNKKPFANLNQLLKIAGIGDRVFQQSAGFLRIKDGDNPLDAGAVHPESYFVVEEIAQKNRLGLSELVGNKKVLDKLNAKDYVNKNAGLPTIIDIIEELKKPGRDPRASFQLFSFEEGIESISDLSEGMLLNGIVTNVTAFGAFVDIGVHQDGLIHISEIANRFVRDPADELRVNQKVSVRVLSIDEKRKRISLSMKNI